MTDERKGDRRSMGNNQNNSIIMVFERIFGGAYSVREKYFYVLLRELYHSKKLKDGWLLFGDAAEGRSAGFGLYGLSARVCKSARKKLKQDELIECSYVHGAKGHRIGTQYRLLDGRLIVPSKMVHAAIMSKFGGGVIHSAKISP